MDGSNETAGEAVDTATPRRSTRRSLANAKVDGYTTKSTVRDSLPLLETLNSIPDEERKCLLKHIDSKAVNVVCCCIHNAIYNAAIVSKQDRKEMRGKLQNLREPLHYLSRLTNNPVKRRRLLVQHGGSLPVLLSAVLPVIRDAASNNRPERGRAD
jgi:hypothetical protein